jgi:hypothetical protein
MFATILAHRHVGPGPSLRLVALPALTAALFANSALFLLGNAFGVFAATVAVPPAGGPITLPAVLTLTIVGVVLGVAAAAAVQRFAEHPVHTFQRIVLTGLILSLGGPMLIPDAPLGLVITLVAMHLVVAATVLAAGITALPD